DEAIEAVKEVRFVADDRSAQRAAPVLLLGARLRQAALVDEEVGRGDLVVREAGEQRSVKRVRALLGDRVDDRAGGSAELGVVLIREHLEFLNGFERRT